MPGYPWVIHGSVSVRTSWAKVVKENSVTFISDLACSLRRECGCGFGSVWEHKVGVWEMGSRRREVCRQTDYSLIRTNLGKLATAVNT